MLSPLMMRWTRAKILDVGMLNTEQHIKAGCILTFVDSLAMEVSGKYIGNTIVSKFHNIRYCRSDNISIHLTHCIII